MSTATSSAELLPGYWVDAACSGAWRSIPWPGNPRLEWNHPDRLALLPFSLGPGLIRFAERWFVNATTGEPWRYTTGQKMFLMLAYAVDEQRGRWLYRSAVKRGGKGTGKDPFGASVCLLELIGPTRVGRNEDGTPIGVRHRLPLVQIAANSEAQGKDVLRVANAMLPRATREEFGINCGELRTVLTNSGGRLELLTASEKSAEGDPATHIMLNETHHMLKSNGGHDVSRVARRNVGKSPAQLQARAFEYTNAHAQGEDSIAEQSFEAWRAQQLPTAKRRDILYDSIEAAPSLNLYDDDERRLALAQAYADAPWSDTDRIEDEILDPRTSVADAIRYYLNGLAATEDAWVNPRAFDALARPDTVVADGERIAMFLDCSKSGDSTGLVGCRIDDGFVFTIGLWQRPHGDRGKEWLAPREEVDAAVRAMFDRYTVCWFGVDPSPARDDENEAQYWLVPIDRWHRDFGRRLRLWATPGTLGHSVKFDMRLSQRGGAERNRAFTEQAELVARMIDEDAALFHDGDAGLRMHTHNAKRRPNQWGVSLGKVTRDSGKLVDLAVCMVGASLGRRLVLNSGKVRQTRRGEGRAAIL